MATVRSFLERPETIVHTTESNFFGRKKVKIVAILHGQICRATVVTKRNGTKVQSEKLSDGSQIITTTYPPKGDVAKRVKEVVKRNGEYTITDIREKYKGWIVKEVVYPGGILRPPTLHLVGFTDEHGQKFEVNEAGDMVPVPVQ